MEVRAEIRERKINKVEKPKTEIGSKNEAFITTTTEDVTPADLSHASENRE